MKKTLIAYFTRTGITKKLAEDTAKQTGADLFAIEPVKEYSSSYLICVGQAKIENLQNARPAIKAKPQNLQDYDTIVVMFPIWCSSHVCSDRSTKRYQIRTRRRQSPLFAEHQYLQ